MRALGVSLVLVLVCAPAALGAGWPARKAEAIRYVQQRAGVESFALVDDRAVYRANPVLRGLVRLEVEAA